MARAIATCSPTNSSRHTWAIPDVSEIEIEDHDGRILEVKIPVTFSTFGPPYTELLTRVPDTVWDVCGLHHVGYWCDDVIGETARLMADGWALDTRGTPDENGEVRFSYLSHPALGRIELVNRNIEADICTWVAGGEFRLNEPRP